jgi:hypothetical protein
MNAIWVYEGCKEFLYHVGFKNTEEGIIELAKTGKEIQKIQHGIELLNVKKFLFNFLRESFQQKKQKMKN